MEEAKTMAEQAQDEWLDLMVDNIETLIPKEWNETLNNVILPKMLKILKMAVKKSIQDTHKMVGKDKYIMVCNIPTQLTDGKIIDVPHFTRFNKSQLKNEIELNSHPELLISYLDVYAKIDSYTNVKDIMADIKNGTLLTGVIKTNLPAADQQKQIESPNTGNQ